MTRYRADYRTPLKDDKLDIFDNIAIYPSGPAKRALYKKGNGVW